MGQRLIISEEERSQINKMYGLVNEQDSKEGPLKLQVFGPVKYNTNDVKLVFLIEVDRKPIDVNNTETTFKYKIRGNSKEYEGYFDTRNPGKIEINKCELLEDKVVPQSHYYYFSTQGATGCPEGWSIKLKLSPEGSEQMEQLFGKESGYVSNDKGDDMSNMA
jgi:hypothetical protein